MPLIERPSTHFQAVKPVVASDVGTALEQSSHIIHLSLLLLLLLAHTRAMLCLLVTLTQLVRGFAVLALEYARLFSPDRDAMTFRSSGGHDL